MKIISCEKAENCFESDFVYIYFFDTEWTKDSIKGMKIFGTLTYYETFPRPMFQVKCPDNTIIKGVQGEKECRIIFSRKDPAGAQESFDSRWDDMHNKGKEVHDGSETA
jgi:hypothetical protein